MENQNYSNKNVFSKTDLTPSYYSSLEERANDSSKKHHYVVASVLGGPKQVIQHPDVYIGFGSLLSRFRR